MILREMFFTALLLLVLYKVNLLCTAKFGSTCVTSSCHRGHQDALLLLFLAALAALYLTLVSQSVSD